MGQNGGIDKRFSILFWVSLGSFMVLVSLVLWIKEGGHSSGIREISSGWVAISDKGEWQPYVPGEILPRTNQSRLTLKKKLTCPLPTDAALFLPPYSAFQAFEISLENSRIYRFGQLASPGSNRHLYLKWHMIPLGPDACDKEMIIRFRSDHHRHIGLIGSAFIGSPSHLIYSLVFRDLDITVLAFLMVIAGLGTLILFTVDDSSRKTPLALFSAMAFSAGIYILTESRITQFFVPVTPIFSHLHYISFFVFSICTIAFVEKILGPGTMNLVRRIWQALILIPIAGLILDTTSLIPWDISFGFGLWTLLIFLIPLGVQMVNTALGGKTEARILCTGFGILIGLGIVDLAAGLRMIRLDSQAIFPWGLLFLLFTFIWTMAYSQKREQEALLRAKRREEEAITAERHRIAREIHDGLAQDLAAMNMKAGLWKHLLEKAPDKLHQEFSRFETLISKSIRDVRGCIYALRPIDLETSGLKKGVADMIRDFEEQYDLKISYTPGETSRIPDHLEPVLYRIIQEGLNNIAKHARATHVFIQMKTDRKRVGLIIEDNGRGFVSKRLDSCYKNGHLGLKQIRERVEETRGEFSLKTAPEQGTRLSAVIPLNITN